MDSSGTFNNTSGRWGTTWTWQSVVQDNINSNYNYYLRNTLNFHSGYTTSSANIGFYQIAKNATTKRWLTNQDNWDAGYLDGYMNFRPMMIYDN